MQNFKIRMHKMWSVLFWCEVMLMVVSSSYQAQLDNLVEVISYSKNIFHFLLLLYVLLSMDEDFSPAAYQLAYSQCGSKVYNFLKWRQFIFNCQVKCLKRPKNLLKMSLLSFPNPTKNPTCQNGVPYI